MLRFCDPPGEPMFVEAFDAWQKTAIQTFLSREEWEAALDPWLRAHDMADESSWSSLPAFLSLEEQSLWERLSIFPEGCTLESYEDYRGALALLARGWVRMETKNASHRIRWPWGLLPEPRSAAGGAQGAPTSLFALQASINGLLYMRGVLPEEQALRWAGEYLSLGTPEPRTARHWLRAAFDFIRHGDLVYYVHSGFLDPAAWLANHCPGTDWDQEIQTGDLMCAMRGVMPEEEPGHAGLMAGLTRMGIDSDRAEQWALAVRILIKQGISLGPLALLLQREIGKPCIKQVVRGLGLLYRETPRWADKTAQGEPVRTQREGEPVRWN